MKSKVKKCPPDGHRGITLIALVITIIVLLILAGVTIATLTGENGVLTQAENAKEATEEAERDELRALEIAEAATHLENYEYIDKNDEKVLVPAGFAVSQVEGENTISNGLVVIDKNGNEFVWIPVEITEEERQAGVTFESKYPRTEFLNNAPTEEISADYSEPYANGGYEGEYEEYQEMINSVTEYGGFYIGRYEAGFEGNEPRSRQNQTTTQKVVVKKGVYVYNYVPWGNKMNDIGITMGHEEIYNETIGIVNLSKNFAKENGYDTNKVTSSLIYGIQWDIMLRYIADEEHNVNDSRNWGNYNNSIEMAAENSGKSNMNYTTGRNEAWKAKNIYDIAGNVWEWTMEAYYKGGRVIRGGFYFHDGSSAPAAFRGYNAPFYSGDDLGFRLTLYFK